METRRLDVYLTDDELLEYGKESAKLYVEVKNLESERSEINDKIKPKNLRMNQLNRAIDSGKEERDVECEWDKNFDKDKKILVRNDTGEVIGDWVPLTDLDKQMALSGEYGA